MRAFDVVGEDFELGLGVDRRRAGEQQALERLLAIGLLRVARDLDPGGDRAGRACRRRPSARPGGWCRRARVADDEIGVMALAAAGEQGAGDLGDTRLRRPARSRRRAGCRGRRRRASPRSGSRLRRRRLVGEADEAGIAQHAAVEHQPRALAERDAGQPVGPAVADEGLDDRGLGVGVERRSRRRDDRRRRSRHGRSGRGRPAHDRGRARATSRSCRRGGRADGRVSIASATDPDIAPRAARRRRRAGAGPRRSRARAGRPARAPSARLGQRRQRRKVAPAPGLLAVGGRASRVMPRRGASVRNRLQDPCCSRAERVGSTELTSPRIGSRRWTCRLTPPSPHSLRARARWASSGPAGADDPAAGEDMDEIGLDDVEQALIMGDQQHRLVGLAHDPVDALADDAQRVDVEARNRSRRAPRGADR